MIYNVDQPYEVNVGDLINLSWTSSTYDYCEVYRSVDYGYEEYVATIYHDYYTGSQSYYFSEIAESWWGSVRYIIREGYPQYDVHTTYDIYVMQANDPPTTPGNIISPTYATGGDTVALSWSASIDPDGDYFSYYLERSVNSGSYVYEGYTYSNSYNATINSSWSTVRYRVHAEDDWGNLSGYSYSTVINVIPPEPLITPTYINVPSSLMYGENLSVDWDMTSNGEDVLYNLELSFNDEPFKTVPTSTSVKIIPSWCTKVVVRVRAVNNIGTSDYITSSPVNIIHSNIFTKVGGEIKRYSDGWIKVGQDLKKIKGMWTKINGVLTKIKVTSELTKITGVSALSTSRFYLGSSSVGGSALFAGGISGHGGTRYAVVEAYDSSLTKTYLGALSLARTNTAGASTLFHAIFAGGNVSNSQVHSTAVDAYSYHLVKSTVSNLPTSKNAIAGGNIGDYVLFAGGTNGSTVFNSVDVYDKSLIRTTVSSLNQSGYYIGSSNVGDYLLFAGGTNGSSIFYGSVTAYNKNLVRSIPTSLYEGVMPASSAVKDYAIFAGGHAVNSTTSSWVNAYNKNLVNTYPTGLSVSRGGSQGGRLGEFALFAGGNSGSINYNTVDVYDSSLVRTSGTALSVSRTNLAGAEVNKHFIFAGGTSTGSSSLNTVDVYKYD